jgi:hypothetical protein
MTNFMQESGGWGGEGNFELQCIVSMSQKRVRGERATCDVISCSTYISLSRPPDSSTPVDYTVRTTLVPHALPKLNLSSFCFQYLSVPILSLMEILMSQRNSTFSFNKKTRNKYPVYVVLPGRSG